MKTDRSQTPSFFDDKDSFRFTKPEPKHSDSLLKPHKLQSLIICQCVEPDFTLSGIFKLHDSFLVYYSDEYPRNPVFVLDSSYARLSKIERNSNGSSYKLRLSRNGSSFDFHFVNQDEANFWRDELKSYCILNDFADQFDLIHLLGRGAFASVTIVS